MCFYTRGTEVFSIISGIKYPISLETGYFSFFRLFFGFLGYMPVLKFSTHTEPNWGQTEPIRTVFRWFLFGY